METSPNMPRSQLPRELVAKLAEWVPPIQFLRAWSATCPQFSFRWYIGVNFNPVVRVPDDVATLNAAINMLASAGHAGGKGLVLVRPGRYAESVRVTQNCHILGYGPCDEIVVEAPGWESALVSAGLGGRNVPTLFGWETLASGEDACVENLTFRCRNEHMKGRCIYIVMGQLHMMRCNIEGGVLVSGACTAPQFSDCRIRGSRGCGLHLTDHCRPVLRRSVVTEHGRHGILIDRQSSPEVIENRISKNAVCGIRVFCGVRNGEEDRVVSAVAILDNIFEDNGDAEIITTPTFVGAEESDIEIGHEE